jgi:DNA mismatch repair ATPase MutS
MDTNAEEDIKEAMAGKDEEKEAMSMEKDEPDLDSEKKGRSGPEGFVEAGLMGEESQGKKLKQAPQVGPLYKEWTNEEFATLDLTTENVEKAYEAFKAEQLEKMAYDSLKKQFESRFVDETSARQNAVAKSEYDAKNEVETLREEFATLRKSLIERNDEIVKSQTITVPEINVAEMSWGEVHNFMAQYEGGN